MCSADKGFLLEMVPSGPGGLQRKEHFTVVCVRVCVCGSSRMRVCVCVRHGTREGLYSLRKNLEGRPETRSPNFPENRRSRIRTDRSPLLGGTGRG